MENKSRPRHETILEENESLLIENLILTNEVLELLLSEQVLTASCIREVQEVEGRVERNRRVISETSRRNEKAFKRFCHVLDTTGHRFMALQLRQQLGRDTDNKLITDSIFKKFPEVKKVLRSSQQELLLDYLNEKVKEGTIARTWKAWDVEKDLAVGALNQHLELDLSADKRTTDLQHQVSELNTQLRHEKGLAAERLEQISALESRLKDVAKKHGQDMQAVLNSFDASERANTLANERMSEFDNQVQSMTSRMRKVLHEQESETEETDQSKRRSHIRTGRVQIDELEKNLNLLLEYTNNLRNDISTKRFELTNQRLEVLKSLNVTDKKQVMSEVMKDSAQQLGERLLNVAKEIEKVTSILHFSCSAFRFEKEDGAILKTDTKEQSCDQHQDEDLHLSESSFTSKMLDRSNVYKFLQLLQVDLQMACVQIERLMDVNKDKSNTIRQKCREIEDLQQKLLLLKNQKNVVPTETNIADNIIPKLPPINHKPEARIASYVSAEKPDDNFNLFSSEGPSEVKKLSPVYRMNNLAKGKPSIGLNKSHALGIMRRRGYPTATNGLQDSPGIIVKHLAIEEHKK